MERTEILIQVEAIENVITKLTKEKDVAEKLGYYYNTDKQATTINLSYVLDRKKIICYAKDPKNRIYAKGVARCHPEDEFSVKNGMLLAELRAKQDMYKYLEKQLLEVL